jgi:hypothetical protein
VVVEEEEEVEDEEEEAVTLIDLQNAETLANEISYVNVRRSNLIKSTIIAFRIRACASRNSSENLDSSELWLFPRSHGP